MGTRSLTKVYNDNGEVLVCMYLQYDGYPSGHGKDLAEFLCSFDEIVNGIPCGDKRKLASGKRKLANGMECLAAQMVYRFKDGVGGCYIYPPDSSDVLEEYTYHVSIMGVRIEESGCDGATDIFNGTWEEFLEFCIGG